MMRRIILLFITIAGFTLFVFAQEKTTPLNFEDFMEIVKSNHPVSKQAELQLKRGDAEVRKSRGGFDPKISISASEKDFESKDYYELIDGGMKIPTWYGLEFKGGYEQNRGLFLNPENNTPGAGLVYAGISVPIGQGLIIDQRRAQLRQAQIYQQSTEQKRRSIYNNILFDASKSYWDWYKAFRILRIFTDALAVAEQRLDAVKRSAELGDLPSIDTLEAGIQVQNRRLALRESELDYANASALLSVFLWNEDVIPLELTELTIPDTLQDILFAPARVYEISLRDSLVNNHPDLLQYSYKIESLDIEKRWQSEQLKPKLNLNYNFLNEATNQEAISGFTPNNYKWGLEFNMPVLLRKERGSLLKTKIDIMETDFEMDLKRAEINFKVNQTLNELNTTQSQIAIYTRTVRDYNGLLNGERRKFDAGESSLFLVNRRELGYINAQVKLVELIAKNQKARNSYEYALGILAIE